MLPAPPSWSAYIMRPPHQAGGFGVVLKAKHDAHGEVAVKTISSLSNLEGYLKDQGDEKAQCVVLR